MCLPSFYHFTTGRLFLIMLNGIYSIYQVKYNTNFYYDNNADTVWNLIALCY
jgi:hypothetical protein